MNRSLILRAALLTVAMTIGIFIFVRWRDSQPQNPPEQGAPPHRDRGRVVTPADNPDTTGSSPLPTKSGRPQESEPHPTGKPAGYPYADKVPGKPGFVVSPYTGKQIDVRGIPAGTLLKEPEPPKGAVRK